MRVLLVEDSAADARLVQLMLEEANATSVELIHVSRLADGLRRLRYEKFDAVLLDLGLPDARGLEGLKRVRETMSEVPILVLSGHRDEALAVEAVRSGAQDYLLKGRGDGVLLIRALRYAIERKQAELHMEHLAFHDGLTNLPNRRLLLDRLNQALARTRREKKMLALLFLDLDNFKTINDTLGHAAGDQILRAVADRLSRHMRESDTVARHGGDEFTLLLPEISHLEDVNRFASKVQWALKPPFHVGEREQHVSASIGISLYPDDGVTAEALLRSADAAMYQAKRRGKNLYQFYSGKLELHAAERLSLRNDLRRALDSQEFVLRYQPRVDPHTGRILGVEALLRWQHPTLGLVPPAQFVPLAEEMGLIVPIGHWVLTEACKQGRLWNNGETDHPLCVSVNLSSREIGRRDLCQTVGSVLKATGLPSDQLELELTESGIMRDEDAAADTLRELNALGVRLSIDDFGTGYSSLSRLKCFPIDALKIDRSFVKDLSSDPSDAAIVTGIITMAHGMRLRVVGEGVETAQQMADLTVRGCDEMQGFYFSPPESAQALAGVLAQPPNWVCA